MFYSTASDEQINVITGAGWGGDKIPQTGGYCRVEASQYQNKLASFTTLCRFKLPCGHRVKGDAHVTRGHRGTSPPGFIRNYCESSHIGASWDVCPTKGKNRNHRHLIGPKWQDGSRQDVCSCLISLLDAEGKLAWTICLELPWNCVQTLGFFSRCPNGQCTYWLAVLGLGDVVMKAAWSYPAHFHQLPKMHLEDLRRLQQSF